MRLDHGARLTNPCRKGRAWPVQQDKTGDKRERKCRTGGLDALSLVTGLFFLAWFTPVNSTRAVDVKPPTPIQNSGGVLVALLSMGCAGAAPVDMPYSNVAVDFDGGLGPDWRGGTVSGTAGELARVADMDAKIMTYDFSGNRAFGRLLPATYGSAANGGYTNRTIFSRPTAGAAAVIQVVVTNGTGTAVNGLTVRYTLCVPCDNSPPAETVRGMGVYYTMDQAGVTNWVSLGQQAPPADSAGAQTNIAFTIQPPGGWAPRQALHVMWADANARGKNACYAISNVTFSVMSDHLMTFASP